MYKIYGTPNCGYCVKARNLLKAEGEKFEYYDIQKDLDNRAVVLEKVPGFKTVPQIFKDDEHIGGYMQLKSHLLDQAEPTPQFTLDDD